MPLQAKTCIIVGKIKRKLKPAATCAGKFYFKLSIMSFAQQKGIIEA
jgi:hypothetical protein